MHEGQWQKGSMRVEARGTPVAKDSFTDGESRLKGSWSVHASEFVLSENLAIKSYQRWLWLLRGFVMTVTRQE